MAVRANGIWRRKAAFSANRPELLGQPIQRQELAFFAVRPCKTVETGGT